MLSMIQPMSRTQQYDPGMREKVGEQRDAPRPNPVGVEDDTAAILGMIGLEQRKEQPPAFLDVEEHGELAGAAHLVLQCRGNLQERTGHRRMEARVLPQQRG